MAITKVTSGLISADAASVDLNIDAGTLYVDSTNNRVGIGTTSPSSPLHVRSSATTEILAQCTSANAANSGRFVAKEADATGYGGGFRYDGNTNTVSIFGIVSNADKDVISYPRGGTQIEFKTDGSERMRIDSSGNVGIGNTTPSSFYESHLVVGDGAGDEAITVYSGSSNTGYLLFGDATSGNARFAGQVRYDHANNRLEFATNESSTARVVVDSIGRVGIGTTSPSQLLSVSNLSGGASLLIQSSNASSAGNLLFGDSDSDTAGRVQYTHSSNTMALHTNGSERMRIDSSGNVGIGTDNPLFKLHVNTSGTSGLSGAANRGMIITDSVGARIILEDTGATSGAKNFMLRSEADEFTISGLNDDGSSFTTQNMFVINGNTANVGIGVSGPASILHLYANDPQILLDDSGTQSSITGQSGNILYKTSSVNRDHVFYGLSTEVARITGDGNVGIGTNNPSGSLHILNTSGGQAPANYLNIQGATANNSNYPGVIFTGGTLANVYPYISLTNGGLALNLNAGSHTTNYNNTANIVLQGSVGDIIFSTSSGTSTTEERMRIDSSGNIGIGTSSPEKRLHVSISDTGYTAVTGQTVALFERNGDCHVTIRSNAANHSSIKFADDGSSRGEIRYVHGSGTDNMRLYTAASERMRIDSSGNVGIGTGSDGIGAKTKIKTNTSTNNWHLELTEDNAQDYTGREFSSRHVSMWVDATGSRNKIRIPYTAQSGAWRKYLIKYDFVSVAYNSNTSIHAGGGTFAAHTLNSGNGNITDLHKFGNVASVSIDKTNYYFEINLTNAIPTGLNNATGVFLHLMVLEELNGTDLTGVDLV